MIDGLLVVDKPQGPTSHDVVARLRRCLRTQRIGHTGTLDPLATGVLPVVIGRATRLAQFLSASTKSYEAVIRLGVETDTYDAEGAVVGEPFAGALPSRIEIETALESFRGTFAQRPPAFSAKKIAGTRSYELARRNAESCRVRVKPDPTDALNVPAAVRVTLNDAQIVSFERDVVMVRVDCSAGFYVRSLAHDLGERLGTGGHLVALRRTRSGEYTLDDARPLADIERDRAAALDAIVPLERLLPGWPALELNEDGAKWAAHGRRLGPEAGTGRTAWPSGGPVRLMDRSGRLIGLARAADAGLLHPFVIFV